MKNILVAIDSCETTIESPLMQRTIELATAFSSKVRILHAVPQSQQPPFNIDKNTLRHEVAHERRDEHDFLLQLANCLRDRNIETTSLLVEGSTIEIILHESDRFDIDLIILGCHKHNELFGTLMNDTDESLLSNCSHPIMFVPMLE